MEGRGGTRFIGLLVVFQGVFSGSAASSASERWSMFELRSGVRRFAFWVIFTGFLVVLSDRARGKTPIDLFSEKPARYQLFRRLDDFIYF